MSVPSTPPPVGGDAEGSVTGEVRSPVATELEALMESSFRAPGGECSASLSSLVDLARSIRFEAMTRLDTDARVTKAVRNAVGEAFDQVVGVVERVVVMNGFLTGRVQELKEQQREIRGEFVRMVVDSVNVKMDEVRGVVQKEAELNKDECVKGVKEVVGVMKGEVRSYAGALSKGLGKKPEVVPNFSLRKVRPRQADDVVLVFPEGEGSACSSKETRERVRQAINPRVEGIQVKGVRGIRDGGVAVVLGDRGQADRVKGSEGLRKAGLRVAEPRLQRPRVMLYDVPQSLSGVEIAGCVYEQGSVTGLSKDEFMSGFKVVSRVNAAEDLCNCVVECSPKVRELLREKGRVFVEWSSCRVVDFARPLRCFKCLAYGHMSGGCKSETVCEHCGGFGHNKGVCDKKGEPVVCVNCKRAKRECGHDVRSRDCPVYVRALERVIRATDYGC